SFENTGNDRRDRLTDGEDQVTRAEFHMWRQPVADAPAALHDRQCVRVGTLEEIANGFRSMLAERDLLRKEAVHAARRLFRRNFPCGDLRARHQFAGILECPAVERAGAPGGKRHLIATKTVKPLEAGFSRHPHPLKKTGGRRDDLPPSLIITAISECQSRCGCRVAALRASRWRGTRPPSRIRPER